MQVYMTYNYPAVRLILPEEMISQAKMTKKAYLRWNEEKADFAFHNQSFQKHNISNMLYLRNEHGDHPIICFSGMNWLLSNCSKSLENIWTWEDLGVNLLNLTLFLLLSKFWDNP